MHFPPPSLADPTRCPRQRRRHSRPHLSLSQCRSDDVDCAACCASCANNSSICFNFLLSFFSAFSRFVCLFCVFAKCFVVFLFLFCFLCSFFWPLCYLFYTFFLFNLRLLPVLVFGKLFSGSPDINTHTIYQLGLEFSLFFCFLFTSFVVSVFLLLSLAPFYRISARLSALKTFETSSLNNIDTLSWHWQSIWGKKRYRYRFRIPIWIHIFI